MEYAFIAEADEAYGVHRVRCDCGQMVMTTSKLIARRFVREHVGEHATNRIVDLETEEEE